MPAADKTPSLTEWQQTLDYLLFRKPTLRPDEIAKALGISKRTVTRALTGPLRDASGKVVRPWLLGFAFNAGDGKRFIHRVPRDCAIIWLSHCVNYLPEDKVSGLAETFDSFCARDLLLLRGLLDAALKKKL